MQNRILIVDDDEITLKLLAKVLSAAGYQVDYAKTGYEALQKIRKHTPHLVVLDLTLPDIDGAVVFEDIRQDPNLSELKTIVLSSRDDPKEIAMLLNKGVSDYIVKRRGAENELLGKCASYFSSLDLVDIPRGQMISFFSAKGGNGTSTLCMNLAHALAKQVAPKETIVADLVLPLGSISLMAGQEECITIAELSSTDQKLTLQTLSDCFQFTAQWNFAILAGSRTPGEAQKVNPNGILPLFQALGKLYDYVFVDVGRTLSRISIPIIQQSSIIVAVLGADKVTVNLSRNALDYLKELGIDKNKIFPILNRAVGLEGLTKDQIEEIIEIPITGTVAYTGNNFTLATNQNLPYQNKFPNEMTSITLNSLANKLLNRIDEFSNQ